jgi:hypothetical protein
MGLRFSTQQSNKKGVFQVGEEVTWNSTSSWRPRSRSVHLTGPFTFIRSRNSTVVFTKSWTCDSVTSTKFFLVVCRDKDKAEASFSSSSHLIDSTWSQVLVVPSQPSVCFVPHGVQLYRLSDPRSSLKNKLLYCYNKTLYRKNPIDWQVETIELNWTQRKLESMLIVCIITSLIPMLKCQEL